MKKFAIRIPTPCHEDWNDMTPQGKGRFCASCQKTVIDFSVMSDRQIAEFFKKPAGLLCGRFHQDQLEREIQVPRKRIPWVRYFFQVSWPAFVLLLKACGEKGSLQGKVAVESFQNKRAEEKALMVGGIFSEIMPVDSLQTPKPPVGSRAEETFIAGELAPSSCRVVGDTIAVSSVLPEDVTRQEIRPMDTVTVTGYQNHSMGGFMAGGISVVTIDTLIAEKKVEKETEKEDIQVNAFPNPVRAGSQLTIALASATDAPKQLQLISSGGALIRSLSSNLSKSKSITLPIPAGLAAGTYFVRIVTESQHSTTKIIILN